MPCPKCGSEFTYEQDNLLVCSQCFHEFDPAEVGNEDKIFDSNGNELQNGDSVLLIIDFFKNATFYNRLIYFSLLYFVAFYF